MKGVYEKVAAVGLDVHAKFSTVTMRDAEARVVRREKLEHGDRSRLRQRLSEWPREVPLVLEASFGWGWLADLMTEMGLRPVLSNCLKVEHFRKMHGAAKTNRKDADLLSLLPFEKDDWWKVWLAPPEVRDQRETMRYRSALVAIQTGTKNRISAVLHRYGVLHEFADLFGVQGYRFLEELSREGRWSQGQVLPGARTALGGLLELLDQVRKQLAQVSRRLHAELEATEQTKRLDGIPGIGLILAHTIQAEIGRLDRFRSHRSLASYSLLAPMSDDTGEEDPGRAPLGRHLGHRGNRTLKWAFLEAAHGAVKRGGKWRRMFDDATEEGRKNRNTGYVKVARELVKVVYVVWKKNVDYSDTPPARPGSRKPAGRLAAEPRRESAREFFGSSRSGMGQSSRPMAAVQ